MLLEAATTDAHTLHTGEVGEEENEDELQTSTEEPEEDADKVIVGSRENAAEKAAKEKDMKEHLAQVQAWVEEESLMPFWVMPISFSIKIGLTMVLFPPIRMSPVERTWGAGFKRLAAQLFSVGFVCLALNTWYCDITKILAARRAFPGDTKKLIQVIGLTWICSANLLASIPVSLSVTHFSPRQLYKLEGKQARYYPEMYSYPMVIGDAKWLPWDKHIFFLVLLPYYLPFRLIRCEPLTWSNKEWPSWTLSGMTFSAFIILIHLAVFLKVLGWLLWGVLTLCTAFFWAHARTKAEKFWNSGLGITPLFILLFVLLTNKLIVFLAPFPKETRLLFQEIVGWNAASDRDEEAEAFRCYIAHMVGFADVQGEDGFLWSVMRKAAEKLRGFQSLDDDFHEDQRQEKEPPEGSEGWETSRYLLRAVVASQQLDMMCSTLITTQLMIIILVRWSFNESDDFVGAFATTMTSRTVPAYFGHLLDQATAASKTDLSKLMSQLWELL